MKKNSNIQGAEVKKRTQFGGELGLCDGEVRVPRRTLDLSYYINFVTFTNVLAPRHGGEC